MMRFAAPWMLFALLIVPVYIYWQLWRNPSSGIRISSAAIARAAGSSWRRRLHRLPLILRSLCLALIILALARPQHGQERMREITEGVAIEMVVDRSGSMRAEMDFKGQRYTRLDVVKHVFYEFVHGDQAGLQGRPNDLVGLVAFARHAETMCPLTLSHEALSEFLKATQLALRREEDGTAIGDGIALAAARLKTAEETVAKQDKKGDASNYVIKSKIIILLTDGIHNAGKRSPMESAELASQWGIKIYTIGVGGDGVTGIQTPFGMFQAPTGRELDEAMLQEIANKTGGIYRRADDAESLVEIYKEIDRLERTEIQADRFFDYRELFAGFVKAALVFLGLELLLSTTVLRKIP
ncbi:MAG: aerotolerance protein BatA [Candidatus Hydrogenedentota bacterium]